MKENTILNSSWPFIVDQVNEWGCFQKFFSKEECEEIKNLGKNNFEEGLINGSKKQVLEKKIRNSKVYFIHPCSRSEWLFRKLTDVITEVNKKLFKFNLTGLDEGLQLTLYEKNCFYVKHLDKSFDHKVRKLSVSIQLDDPSTYEGGDLLLHTSSTPLIMNKERGSVIFFPSFILHEVKPVTKGKRYSLVCWVTGPNFS